MNAKEEKAYERGQRSAFVSLLNHALGQLSYDKIEGKPQLRWISEREEVIAKLREVCGDFGDNEWGNDLHLADVIEKHLAKHLHNRDNYT